MFTFMQIFLLCLYYGIWAFIGQSCQFFVYGSTVFVGWMSGLIMGDPVMGLLIGGTLQLMSLGVGGWGGSSVPNYAMGALVGTCFAIATGNGLEAGMAVGIPVATLGVQLDVLAKTVNSFFLHRAMECSDRLDFKTMKKWLWAGCTPVIFVSVLPILLVLTAGADLINTILAAMPVWLNTGLTVASGLLPAMGFAILLKYLPTVKYASFLIMGFVLTAYVKIPMLGVALIGFAIAYYIFNQLNSKTAEQAVATAEGGNYDE